jgi:hypothetical protein
MNTFALLVCVTLLVFLAIQAVAALAFVRALRRPRPPLLPDEDCPKAAVLLSVRGDDPFLARCVEGLLQQDYPCYAVRIVVDHVEDPAWETIAQVVRRHPGSPVHVEPLAERLGTCTLKANSLLQAVAGLDESDTSSQPVCGNSAPISARSGSTVSAAALTPYEVFAILDADVIPHRTWLRELVGPFRDGRVAATTGNRWYMPAQPTLASLVRYVWNAGAAVQMHFNRCTWGGGMAVRARLFRETDLRERWRHAVASDTALDTAVRQVGGKVAFVPTLMSINRESCTLGSFWRFMQRQLLHSRLKGRDWSIILFHGSTTLLAQLAAAVLLTGAGVQGQGRAAALAGGGLAVYACGTFALLGLLEAAVRKAVRDRGESTQWLAPHAVWRLLLAVPLAQFLYTAALPTVSFLRRVTWRGVNYRIEGRGVRLVRYQPYRRHSRAEGACHSL